MLSARKCEVMAVRFIRFGTSRLDGASLQETALAHQNFPLIDIKTAAKWLGVSVRTVRHWQAAGLMPPRTQHGHRCKYNKVDILAFKATRDEANSGRKMKQVQRGQAINES